MTLGGCAGAARTLKLPKTDRIEALLDHSGVARLHGLEILGYEVAPDWRSRPIMAELQLTVVGRDEANALLVRASNDELERAQLRGLDAHRFHYRYEAAALAMEAAKLMPDNTDEKAIVLCMAGSWLKARDAEAADVYYKTLVRHCRKTAIGHWPIACGDFRNSIRREIPRLRKRRRRWKQTPRRTCGRVVLGIPSTLGTPCATWRSW